MRTRTARRTLAMAACVAVMVGATHITLAATPQQQVPEGYQQILPRGGIPAIDDPIYVPASEASIRDDAWVLGIIIDDQARAFSLELLNGHEVVNDTIGDTDFAAVW